MTAVAQTDTDQARIPVFRALLGLQALASVMFGIVPLLLPKMFADLTGYSGKDVVAEVEKMADDDGFDALAGRYGDMVDFGIVDPLLVTRSALQNAASIAGLVLTTNTLVAEEKPPWAGAIMSEIGDLAGGLPQPSPDSTTPQSMGLGPSVG